MESRIVLLRELVIGGIYIMPLSVSPTPPGIQLSKIKFLTLSGVMTHCWNDLYSRVLQHILMYTDKCNIRIKDVATVDKSIM